MMTHTVLLFDLYIFITFESPLGTKRESEGRKRKVREREREREVERMLLLLWSPLGRERGEKGVA